MKKVLSLVLSMLIIFLLTGCTEKAVIPNVSGTDFNDAKAVISSMGFVPQIIYEVNESIEKNKVIRTEPEVGNKIEKGSQVIIVVSKGANKVVSKDSYANWTFISNAEDNWQFYNPYIVDNTLYIECYDVYFGSAMEWRDRYNEGTASGTVAMNDTFDKVVPARIKYNKRQNSAKEHQSFTIIVPLTELTTDRPTNMYFKIGIVVGGKEKDLYFSFSMTW